MKEIKIGYTKKSPEKLRKIDRGQLAQSAFVLLLGGVAGKQIGKIPDIQVGGDTCGILGR